MAIVEFLYPKYNIVNKNNIDSNELKIIICL